MPKTIKTTIRFDASPSAIQDINEGTPGCYRIRVFFQNPKGDHEEPTIQIPGDRTTFVIEAPLEQAVTVLIAYISPNDRRSPATPMQFVVSETVPPLRPTNPRIDRCVPKLDVLDIKDDRYFVSVGKSEFIKPGALGEIVGVMSSTVRAVFEDDALIEQTDGHNQFFFNPDDDHVSVICPDQTSITIAQYLNLHSEK